MSKTAEACWASFRDDQPKRTIFGWKGKAAISQDRFGCQKENNKIQNTQWFARIAPGLINHQMLMLGQAQIVFGTRAWNLVSLETMIDVIITIVLTITMVLSVISSSPSPNPHPHPHTPSPAASRGQEPRQTTSNIGHLNKPSITALIHGLNRILAWVMMTGCGLSGKGNSSTVGSSWCGQHIKTNETK